MNDFNFDELIGGLKKDSADASFREQLLLKSQRTLVRSRALRHIIRAAGVSSCILLLVVGAFVCGRFTADGRTGDVTVADAGENITVSAELVAWLNAAQLFRQLGMEDRMARSVERAGRLLPVNTVTADELTMPAFATESNATQKELVQPIGMQGPQPSVKSINQILTQTILLEIEK